MTRFFFRVLLLIIFTFTLLIFATRLVGSLSRASPLTKVMSKPDGTACDHPCLFGIIPGETSVAQAMLILHTHPLTHDAVWRDEHTLRLPGPAAFIAFSGTEDGLIDAITLTDNLNDTGIPVENSLVDSIVLGEVILAFSYPNIALPASPYFVAEFPDGGITVASVVPKDSKAVVGPSTRLDMIMMYALRTCPKNSVILEVHHWIGFKSVLRYLIDRKRYKFSYRTSGVPVPPYVECQA